MRPNSKLRESRRRRREKSKDSENFRKKPLTDKPKLMHLELKELLKRVRDKLENVKDSSNKRYNASKLILS
jgi:hypothetical protein